MKGSSPAKATGRKLSKLSKLSGVSKENEGFKLSRLSRGSGVSMGKSKRKKVNKITTKLRRR
ncbi:MAG: hypothetical protein C0399_09965 [Syntrophus sp. (in: bacteria)]|nr:hypothetical protein [Syntrophus sp. (in: bacteria)]MBA4418572.1 hypothetical protein [Syntrophus sp. (in: bacteria)]